MMNKLKVAGLRTIQFGLLLFLLSIPMMILFDNIWWVWFLCYFIIVFIIRFVYDYQLCSDADQQSNKVDQLSTSSNVRIQQTNFTYPPTNYRLAIRPNLTNKIIVIHDGMCWSVYVNGHRHIKVAYIRNIISLLEQHQPFNIVGIYQSELILPDVFTENELKMMKKHI